MVISPQRSAAAELGRHLAEGWKREEGTFTVRDVQQKGWTGLDSAEKVLAAAEILEDANWVREVEREKPATGRPPSRTFTINPRLPGK